MDLFDAIKKLFRKEPIEDPPSDFMLHRFLASQKDFAPFCAEISLNIRDQNLVFALWQTILPYAPRAPILKYIAPKKQKIEDCLVEGLMDTCDYSFQEATEAVEIISLLNKRNEIANYYGIHLND